MRPTTRLYEKLMPYYMAAAYLMVAIGLVVTGGNAVLGGGMIAIAVIYFAIRCLK